MNNHMWKKLGEVKAFGRVGIDFLENGRSGLAPDVFSADEIDQLITANNQHVEKIADIAKDNDASDTVDTKAEKTIVKLEKLQDSYLTDEDDWQDPLELLEWSGFFYGGAIVHWSVIAGAAESADISALDTLAETGLEFHHEMLHTSKDAIAELAQQNIQ